MSTNHLARRIAGAAIIVSVCGSSVGVMPATSAADPVVATVPASDSGSSSGSNSGSGTGSADVATAVVEGFFRMLERGVPSQRATS